MPAHFPFLDLPAELRMHIYETLFKAKEPVEVRKYLNNRTLRTLTSTGKKAKPDANVKNVESTNVLALMATCHQINAEIGAMMYAGLTFQCERMSDFSEFTRTLGTTRTRSIRILRIRSYNYHLLGKLTVLTGLKKLVVLVGYQKDYTPPGWIRGEYTGKRTWHWSRKTRTIEALKKFAGAQECLVRFEFTGPDEMHCSRSLTAGEIEAAALEMDEYVRGLWAK